MKKFLQITVIINFNRNIFIFTFSIFKKENQHEVKLDLFSFLKIEEFFIITPFENRFERGSGFILQVNLQNSTGRRPAVYGIIRADLPNISLAYFLRQRFPSGTHLNRVRSDEHSVEALPVGRKLRLRPTWNYQEATGLLTSKVDDNAESVSYTYTTAGQLLTRTWARGPVTTYGYDTSTGELLTVNYSDSTPDVTFTYDRLGRISTATDGLGSRTFAYNAALQPDTETISGLYNASITRNYSAAGVVGRPSGLTMGALYSQTYGYDTKGRYNSTGWTVNAISGSATYTYVTNSDLIGSLTTGSGQATTYAYEPNRNLRTQINNQFSSTLISQYDYVYDQLGRRTSVKNSGSAFAASAFNRFTYNDRSELNESARYLGTDINILTSPVTAELRDYVYDPIGNRTDYTVGTNNGDYTANNLNQYSGENVAGGGSNSFTYDDDGNLTAISGNKNVQYVFNAENQVITMQPATPALNDKKVESVYDYQGRRVQKLISNWSGVAWVPLTTKRFVYDGWNVIEEQTVAGTSKYQVWGLDLSSSPQGAGGVGGLLTLVEGTLSDAYLYDGNGNVSQMINTTTGAIDAHYEYDPYGNSIVASGSSAASNSYRFSTKYLDSEYNLYYYVKRYYDSLFGRWLSRDPLEEDGGLNLYAFLLNNSINYFDALGLWPEPWTGPNGTRAHQLFFTHTEIKAKLHYPGRRLFFDEPLSDLFGGAFSDDRPDVIDLRYYEIWELKPVTHKNSFIFKYADRSQINRYLQQTKTIGFVVGNSYDLYPTAEKIAEWDQDSDLWVEPGSGGFLYWWLKKRQCDDEQKAQNKLGGIAQRIQEVNEELEKIMMIPMKVPIKVIPVLVAP